MEPIDLFNWHFAMFARLARGRLHKDLPPAEPLTTMRCDSAIRIRHLRPQHSTVHSPAAFRRIKPLYSMLRDKSHGNFYAEFIDRKSVEHNKTSRVLRESCACWLEERIVSHGRRPLYQRIIDFSEMLRDPFARMINVSSHESWRHLWRNPSTHFMHIHKLERYWVWAHEINHYLIESRVALLGLSLRKLFNKLQKCCEKQATDEKSGDRAEPEAFVMNYVPSIEWHDVVV